MTSTTQSKLFAWGLLVVLTLLPFLRVLNCGFVAYDDPVYICENTQLQRGLTWENLQWCFSSQVCANWHPLTMLSLLVDYEIAGLHAGWYHAVNLLLHIATASLLFLFLTRSTRRTWLSFWVALLFAIHPLRVESVAWVSERKDVLCGFFWMLTLLSYLSYRQHPNRRRYFLVMTCLLCALLAKPMAVTLPFLLLLVDIWPLQQLTLTPPATMADLMRRAWPLVREKMPLFLLCGVMSVVTYLAQASGGAIRGPDRIDFGHRILDSTANYGFYIVKTLYPVNLSVFYGLLGNMLTLPWIFAIAAALIAVTGLVLHNAPRRPWLPVGWFWYLGTLVPVIGIVQIGAQSFADRYSYLPSIGLFIIAVWGSAEFIDRHRSAAPAVASAAATSMQRLVLGAAAAAVVSLGYLTFFQTCAWQNSIALFANAVETNPRHAFAYSMLGSALAREGQFAAAGQCAEKAIQLAPSSPDGYVCRGIIHECLGEFADATEQYRKALAVEPQDRNALYYMGQSLLKNGQTEEAIQAFLMALAARAHPAACHGNLALVYASHRNSRFRNPDLALKHALAASEITSGRDPRALAALGAAYAENGRFEDAVTAVNRALALIMEPGGNDSTARLQQQLAQYQLRHPWRQDFGPSR